MDMDGKDADAEDVAAELSASWRARTPARRAAAPDMRRWSIVRLGQGGFSLSDGANKRKGRQIRTQITEQYADFCRTLLIQGDSC
jgi:hypothetical protein